VGNTIFGASRPYIHRRAAPPEGRRRQKYIYCKLYNKIKNIIREKENEQIYSISISHIDVYINM